MPKFPYLFGFLAAICDECDGVFSSTDAALRCHGSIRAIDAWVCGVPACTYSPDPDWLHASEEDAEACIARNRKGGTDGDPVTPWKTGKGYLCPSCAALCRSESEASECCTIEEWPETWTCGQPPEICGNRSIHRTEVEARECIASGGHR